MELREANRGLTLRIDFEDRDEKRKFRQILLRGLESLDALAKSVAEDDLLTDEERKEVERIKTTLKHPAAKKNASDEEAADFLLEFSQKVEALVLKGIEIPPTKEGDNGVT